MEKDSWDCPRKIKQRGDRNDLPHRGSLWLNQIRNTDMTFRESIISGTYHEFLLTFNFMSLIS